MSPPKGVCRGCGEWVQSHETAAYAVSGYEVERDAGGQNHVRGRKRTDGLIWHARFHGDCFDQFIEGPRQESLL